MLTERVVNNKLFQANAKTKGRRISIISSPDKEQVVKSQFQAIAAIIPVVGLDR